MMLIKQQLVNLIIFTDPIEQFELTKFSWGFINLDLSFLLIACNFLIFLGLAASAVWNPTSMLAYLIFGSLAFVRKVVDSILGRKHQYYFFSYWFVFCVLIINNLLGLLPWSYTLTSYLVLPIFFSCIFFGATIITGLELRNLRFLNLFSPRSVPKAVFHFLVLIEIVSYITRLISLPIRLFANMVAGHALMKILIAFGAQMIFMSGWQSLIGLLGFLLIALVTMLEIIIAVLQAYVFIFLALIYLSEVLENK